MIRQPNPPRLHGLGNILEGLRPHIITGNLDLAPDLPPGVIGHADAARFGDAFKAGGNVDTIPEDIVVVDDDVPDMDADPEFDPFVLRQGGVLLGHAALDFNGTAYRIHRTGKLDEHSVARSLDDPAAMGGDCGIDEGLSDRLEPGQRAFLVGTHEAAVPGDIRRQHRCQSPFHAFGGQMMPLGRPISASHIKARRTLQG